MMHNTNSPLIAVFGSSRSESSDGEYLHAASLGAALTISGFQVCTGGYAGLMEATCSGAYEAGGQPIGITFEAFGRECNRFVRDQRHAHDLFDRLRALMIEPDAYVIMFGGMGTLAELALAWIHVESGLRPAAPIILLGDCWPPVISVLRQHLAIRDTDVDLVRFATKVEDVLELLNDLLPSAQ